MLLRRGKPPAILSLFDGPNECAASRGQRSISTSPLQSLYLLNSDFVVRQASSLAELAESESGGEVAAAVDLAFRRTLQRVPTQSELDSSLRLIEASQHDGGGEVASDTDLSPTAMTLFCQALLNLSEVCYLD